MTYTIASHSTKPEGCSNTHNVVLDFENVLPRIDLAGGSAVDGAGRIVVQDGQPFHFVFQTSDVDDTTSLRCDVDPTSQFGLADVTGLQLPQTTTSSCGSPGTLTLDGSPRPGVEGVLAIRCEARDSQNALAVRTYQFLINRAPEIRVCSSRGCVSNSNVSISDMLTSGSRATETLAVQASDGDGGPIALACTYSSTASDPTGPSDPPIEQIEPSDLAAAPAAAHGPSPLSLRNISVTLNGPGSIVLSCGATDEHRAARRIVIRVDSTCQGGAFGSGFCRSPMERYRCIDNIQLTACGSSCVNCAAEAQTRLNWNADPKLTGFDTACSAATGACEFRCRLGYRGDQDCSPAPEWALLSPTVPNCPRLTSIKEAGTYDAASNTAFVLAQCTACPSRHIVVYVVDHANGLDAAGASVSNFPWRSLDLPGAPVDAVDVGYNAVSDDLFAGYMDGNSTEYQAYVLHGVLRAATPAWESVPTFGFSGFTNLYASAYTIEDRLVVYGGSDGVQNYSSDIQILTGAIHGPRTWARFPGPPNGPAGRQRPQAFVTTDGRLVVFGGQAGLSSYLSDTWVADTLTTSPVWRRNPATPTPSARVGGGFVYLGGALDRSLLFGGTDGHAPYFVFPPSDIHILEGTQALPGTTGRWVPVGSGNFNAVYTRSFPAVLGYDPSSRRVVTLGALFNDEDGECDHHILASP